MAHIDGMGEIDWERGVSHANLLVAHLVTGRVATQMQLQAHPKSAETANSSYISTSDIGEQEVHEALSLPGREIRYTRPTSVGRAVGRAVFNILTSAEYAHRHPKEYPDIDALTLVEMEDKEILTARLARQINLANLGVEPDNAKATIRLADGQIINAVRTPLIGEKPYPNALEVTLDVGNAIYAILSGNEIYQKNVPPSIVIDSPVSERFASVLETS